MKYNIIPYSVKAPNTIIMQAIIQTPIALTPLVFGIDGLRFTLKKDILYYPVEIFLHNDLRYLNTDSISYLILIKTSNKTTVTVNRPGIDAVPIRNPSQLLKTIRNEGRNIENAYPSILLLNSIFMAK